ncbi:cupin domain-containing protein [Streptomyces sp. NPDC054796]
MESRLDPQHVIDQLGLSPHPEGGWYASTYTSGIDVRLPERTGGGRPTATLIHYLLSPGEESAWHVVGSDEIWLWHLGGPLVLRTGGAGPEPDTGTAGGPGSGGVIETPLGPDLGAGQRLQGFVPAGTWQSARPAGDEAVLVSCVVSPGFDFADFRLYEGAARDRTTAEPEPDPES